MKSYRSLIFASIIILFGCKKNDATQNTTDTGNGTIQGVITDLKNTPLSQATVSSGMATTTTDANGKFTMNNVKFNNDTAVVKFSKNGFFEGAKCFVSASHSVGNVTLQLIPKTVSATIASNTGGMVAIQGGGTINFGSGFKNAITGNAYTGNVLASTHYIDPSDPNFSSYAPGNLKSANVKNQQGSLQSFGVVLVEIDDVSGNKLQLAAGNTATINLPTSLQGKAPSAVPLWYFDADKGVWKQEGIAEKQTGSYVSTVSHFTPWNPGNVVDTSQYISLTLNGVHYAWSPSDSDGVHADYIDFDKLTGIIGGSAVYNYYFKGQVINGNTIAAGIYPFVLKLLINGKFYSSNSNDTRNKTNVTEFGPVGGYLKGTASGFIDSSAYTCSYKLIRIQ